MARGIITRLLNNDFLQNQTGVMKICLGISILFHLGLIIGFQSVFPVWKSVELRSYTVEIIRPPTEDLDKEDLKGAEDTLEQEKENASSESQDTISLDTKDERYIQYAGVIKMKIADNWDYPAEAKLYLMEGRVMVIFSLAKDGRMIQLKIEKGSGYDILDKEVLRAIKTSVPFPPFPETIKLNRLNIRANFEYRLPSGK